jgi:hypothetical protein
VQRWLNWAADESLGVDGCLRLRGRLRVCDRRLDGTEDS